jgi:xanthine dehydrogenase iron-sulfur cluster and FAD-binding subunit A
MRAGAHPRPAHHAREGLLRVQGEAGVIRLTVNGTAHEVEVPSYRTLLDCLRDDLGLTGSREGC